MDKTVRVIFIIPETCSDKSECSEVMHRAYEACKTNLMSVEWLESPGDFDELSAEKMDFLVFEKFEGATFNRFKNSRCVIVGPSCLLTCLVEGRPIPNFPWPIFNVAMSDCSVTVSHLAKHVKEKIKEKVQIMAGYYTDSVYDTTTHLITDTVKTDKYLRASEAGVKVMVPAWIDEVWEASLSGNIHCNDAQFDKYRCPPFYNLTIAITGFKTHEDRLKIAQLVEENGGNFRSQLHVSTTDVLICEEFANSEKYKVARKSRSVKCVTYNWLLDSIQKGYALPDEAYSMKKATASTPTKFDNFVDPNFSMMSSISSVSAIGQSLCQETMLPPSDMTLSEVTPRKRKSSSLDDISDMIDAIDLKAVKRAGSFLDGCCVYIAGFTPDQRDALSRILSIGDATRYDQISERVTHIIIGDPTSTDVKAMQCRGYAAPLVSLAWVNECIRQKKVVEEERFLVNLHRNDLSGASSSPLSQKGLKLLRREISVIEPAPESTSVEENDETLTVQQDAVDIDAEIMQQYKKIATTATEDDTLANLLRGENFDSKCIENQKRDDAEISNQAVCNAGQTSTQAASFTMTETEDETTTDGVFRNLKFKIYGHTDENLSKINDFIENNCGQILSEDDPGIPDFCVVPTFFDEDLEFPPERIVTDYYLMSCINENAIVDVEYFYRPLKTDNSFPLDECIITLSVYTGPERSYLIDVVEKLGGISQDQLCRVPKPDIYASTHLLCPEAQGRKYEAALKWGLPVIEKDWLLECARLGQYANEEPFLIGNAKASERSKAAKLREASTLRMDSKENTSDSLPNVKPSVGSDKDKDEVSVENLAPNTSRTGSTPKTPKHYFQIKNKSASERSNSAKLKGTTTADGKENTSDSLPNVAPSVDTDEDNDNEVFLENLAPNTSRTENAQKTPKNYFPGVNKPCYTPLRHDSSLTASSQVTPVNKIMERFQMNAMLEIPTVTPPMTRRYNDVDTPETPYGAFITPNPSPHLRKEMLKWINRIPEHKPRRDSTPFSEIKRQLWNKICPLSPKSTNSAFPQPNFNASEDPTGTAEAPVKSTSNSNMPQRFSTTSEADFEALKDDSSTNVEVPETPQRSKIDSNLQQLQEMLASSGGNTRRSVKKRESILPVHEAPQLLSQVYSVGWDYSEAERAVERLETVEADKKRVFMITSLDRMERDNIIREIQELGGRVSELNQYDPEGTHLITPKPQRTEKILCSMAAGKWILHPSYVTKSIEAGKFLKEDEFEYGNPNARKDISVQFERDMKVRPEALHYWRVEVTKRGYGAFHDMRAIVVAARRESIVRVIEAGGGMVINESPPFKDTVFATHCLVDEKTTKDLSLFVPLAKNGVYCVNILYISDFLYRNARDIGDSILPYFTKYYK